MLLLKKRIFVCATWAFQLEYEVRNWTFSFNSFSACYFISFYFHQNHGRITEI